MSGEGYIWIIFWHMPHNMLYLDIIASLLSSSYFILGQLRTIQMPGHTIVRLMIYMHIWPRAKYTKSKISLPKKISEVFTDYFIWEFTKIRYTKFYKFLAWIPKIWVKILPYWHKDRICLIGDAAHATSPALGQGANQAMQDGYLIGKYLSEENTPSDAFEKLFKIRHPSTDKVIKGSQWSARLRSGNMWYSKIFRKGLFEFSLGIVSSWF